jgi:DNA polymerase I
MTIKRTKLKNNRVNIDVVNGDSQLRTFGESEQRFKNELAELAEIDGATLIFNGLESFALRKTSAALALEILTKAPEVYDNAFTGLNPSFGWQYDLEQIKQAEAAWQSACRTYGTTVHVKGMELRKQLIVDQAGLIGLAEELTSVDEIALDIETFPATGTKLAKRHIGDTRKSLVRLISLSANGRTWLVDTVACGQSIEPLRSVLENKDLVIHNALYDMPFMMDHFSIVPKGKNFDTLIAARVLSNEAKLVVWASKYQQILESYGDEMIKPKEIDADDSDEENEEEQLLKAKKKEVVIFKNDPERTSNSLDMLYRRFLGFEYETDQAASDWQLPRLTDEQLVYAASDTAHLIQLKEAIRKSGDSDDQTIIDLDLISLRICLDMYRQGSAIDVERLHNVHKQRTEVLGQIRAEVQPLLPGVKLDSPKDIVRGLGELGVFVESADKHDLIKKKDNPVVEKLIKYRRVAAEVRDLEKLINALHPDGKIHARYNPSGAGTGRMSSSNPNLQNIRRAPSKEDQALGYVNFREFFVGPQEFPVTIVADYNQMELRAVAVVADERRMIKAYIKGEDLHWKTAAGVVPDFASLSDDEKAIARAKAKPANFGLLYGQNSRNFRNYAARNYGIDMDLDEAEEIREAWFELYPGLAEWHENAKELAQQCPEYGSTLLGRKRRLHPDCEGLEEWWCAFQALTNHAIQGSCADASKLALALIDEALDKTKARIIGMVHDEIVAIAKPEVVEEVKAIIEKCMMAAAAAVFGDKLTFVAEAKSGKSWACK